MNTLLPLAALLDEKSAEVIVNVDVAHALYGCLDHAPLARLMRMLPVAGVSAGIAPVTTTDVTAAPVSPQAA